MIDRPIPTGGNMGDLVLGAAIVAAVSIGVFLAGWRLADRARKPAVTAAGVLLVAAALLYAFFLHGNLMMARLLPFSNAIVLSNLFPVLLAGLASVAAANRSIPRWRRAVIVAGLAVLGGFSLALPMIRTAPPAGDCWSPEGVCMQTTAASCSPSAVATMLRHYGIEATEREMIDLCLTGTKATQSLGMYRGLKIKSRGTPYRVEVFRSTIDELRADGRFPVLILVKLPRWGDVDPRYEQEWGWTPGLGHAVVLYGFAGEDRVEIGDPSIGREQWTLDDLRVLWQGQGLRLVPR